MGRRLAAGSLGALLIGSLFQTAICQISDAGVPVTITRFDRSGDKYTLVVHPEKADTSEPYLGTCERFEVRGTYGSLRGAKRNDAELSWLGHRKALEFLQKAFIAGQRFDLGSVGKGFVPVAADNPCIVASRALRLLQDDRGMHVLSYHDATSAQAD